MWRQCSHKIERKLFAEIAIAIAIIVVIVVYAIERLKCGNFKWPLEDKCIANAHDKALCYLLDACAALFEVYIYTYILHAYNVDTLYMCQKKF